VKLNDTTPDEQAPTFGAFAIRPVATHQIVRCLFLLVVCCASYAQNTLGNLAKGEPVAAKGTGLSGQTALSSPIFLEAFQFPEADMSVDSPMPVERRVAAVPFRAGLPLTHVASRVTRCARQPASRRC